MSSTLGDRKSHPHYSSLLNFYIFFLRAATTLCCCFSERLPRYVVVSPSGYHVMLLFLRAATTLCCCFSERLPRYVVVSPSGYHVMLLFLRAATTLCCCCVLFHFLSNDHLPLETLVIWTVGVVFINHIVFVVVVQPDSGLERLIYRSATVRSTLVALHEYAYIYYNYPRVIPPITHRPFVRSSLRPFLQSFSQPASQPTSQPACLPACQPASQQASKPTDRSIDRSID